MSPGKFLSAGFPISILECKFKIFAGIIEKELIWTDEQCTPVGWFTKKCSDLCWETCQETAGCSAVNYSPTTGGCVLRQCALPVPEPTWSFPGYKGFTAKSGKMSQFYNNQ